MADKERISRPSNGSNELGRDTKEDRITGGLSAGSNVQLKKAALSGKNTKDQKNESEKSKNVTTKKK